MGRLEGKVAIITGAAGGIGLATARLFATEGAKLLLVDRVEAPLREAVREIGPGSASHIVADVTRPEDVQRYVAAAEERHGGVDVLINNAGVLGLVQPITDYPVDVFDKVLAVNVRGVWLGLKYAMPAIARRGGGSIVVTASTAGVRGSLGLSAYVASKHAVVGLMRTAALEGAAQRIRVNSVNPSPIETAMVHELEAGLVPGDRAQAKAALAARSPLKRYGTPEEVARLMLFLAGDESSFCSGGIYMIDGARTAM
ncbi:MAG: SDR family oxidoreductase [Alphaproteobacteria bacterium]|nr:SDR family oxidoreductase [Alphaproteobacteria bacterium]